MATLPYSIQRRPAVFLDRDGTLVYPRHYPTRPEELVLYDGLPARLRRLQEEGYLLVVVTNQSGLARGLFTEADLARMHSSLRERLLAHGVWIDAIYHCPHHPDGRVPHLATECECRKPKPGMLVQAASDLGIDLATSWFVGDILDDVEAGNRAGCQTVLVDLGTEQAPDCPARRPTLAASCTPMALDMILGVSIGTTTPVPDTGYVPSGWSLGDLGWSLAGSSAS
jgi:D-glycero-D-manno-heptose 1,7-bisphosphate phosphatase